MISEGLDHPYVGCSICPCWRCGPSVIRRQGTQIVSAKILVRNCKYPATVSVMKVI